jgi:hypothetical protein
MKLDIASGCTAGARAPEFQRDECSCDLCYKVAELEPLNSAGGFVLVCVSCYDTARVMLGDDYPEPASDEYPSRWET